MRTFQQLSTLEDACGTFERLFRAALESLVPDLADAPWHVREREVVNLFVFRHLVPQFQEENLDIGQLGIEVPIRKMPRTEEEKLGKYADLVVWPHAKATIWQTCRPLAHVEWKNISCLEKHPTILERQYESDIRLLMHNRSLVCVSYAVLTDQRGKHVEVRCKRIVDGKDPEDLFLAPLKYPTRCPHKAFSDLQGSYRELLSRPQQCRECSPHLVVGK